MPFENTLKHTLAHFRLIGGVCGVEFAAGDELRNQRGNVVMICARAAEKQAGFVVLKNIAGDELTQLQLAHRSGKIQLAVELKIRRNIGKQLVHFGKAECFQHFAAFFNGVGNIASHVVEYFLYKYKILMNRNFVRFEKKLIQGKNA